MQVSVESTAGLERRLTVELPEEGVEREVGSRLDHLMRTARIPGFRPGKAPMKIVAKRFGAAVRDEVVGDLVRSSFAEALESERLRPAGNPMIDSVESVPGGGVKYTAVFEVFPDIPLTDLESVEVRRPAAAVTDADVDRMVETLRRRRREWREVTRPAEKDDRVTFTLAGEVDGRPLDAGAAGERVVEIGAGGSLPDLENALLGMEPRSENDVEFRYPDDYAPALAGKRAALHVVVRKVEEGVLPEPDAEFIRGFGVESGETDDFRRDVRANLERELQGATSAVVTNRLLEALLERHPVAVPEVLVAEELTRLGQPPDAGGVREAGQAVPGADAEAEAGVEAEAAVRRRLQLGLMLARIVSDHGAAPDPAAVRSEIERMAATYEDPSQVIGWFYSDPAHLRPVESRVAERQAVEAVLGRVRLVDEPAGFDEVMNPGQTSEAPP